MKSKFISLIVSVAVVLGLMLVPAVATPVVDAAEVVGIEVVPSMTKVGYDEAFDVNITIIDTVAQDMKAWTVYLEFNATLMHVTGIDPCTMLPTDNPPDDVPPFPTWDNTSGVLEHQSGTVALDPLVNTSFVVMTVHFRSNNVEGTGSLDFKNITPLKRTWVETTGAVPVLDWDKVVNGTVMVGEAALTVDIGSDKAFIHSYPTEVSEPDDMEYQVVLGPGPIAGSYMARSNFCPGSDRTSFLGLPIKLQYVDAVVNITTGDFLRQIVHLLADLGMTGDYTPVILDRNYVYPGGPSSHGAPYTLGKNWTYDTNMYLPDLYMWVNETLYANVTESPYLGCMVPVSICGMPVSLPCWHVVHTDQPGGAGNITYEDWIVEPTLLPPELDGLVGSVKTKDYSTYAPGLSDTGVLAGSKCPFGAVEITTNGIGMLTGYPNTTKWDWDTPVDLVAHDVVPGWTFACWNGDLLGCDKSATITMSDDKFVFANFKELPPILGYSPSSFDFITRYGQDPDPQTLDIWNSGGYMLDWSLDDDAVWLSEDPTTGSLATGLHDFVDVSVDTNATGTLMDVGMYYANITLTTTGGAVTIPVTLEVKTAETIDVTRDLPGNALTVNETYPGMTFVVYVNFTSPIDDFNAISLIDRAPAGWTVAADNDWCSPAADNNLTDGSQVTYIWYGPYDRNAPFSAKYEVTVPATAIPGINEFPFNECDKAWAGYYFGPDGEYQSCAAGDFEMLVTVPGKIVGETRDVNANVLQAVTVTVFEEATRLEDSDSSTVLGAYENEVLTTGLYWERAEKYCYYTLDTNAMPSVRNIWHDDDIDFTTAPKLALGYTLDFEGDYGLVLKACDVGYAMESVNHMNFVPEDENDVAHPEWQLNYWKAMESVNSWTHPIGCGD